jgi:high affinity Mn2+ porin
VFAQDPDPQRWNLYWQATSIGQYHGPFPSPYSGDRSLQPYAERDVSLTSTLFLSYRLTRDTTLVFNPEIAGGRGFSGVNGLGNPTNGELPRVAAATPKLYLARLFLTHDFALGDQREPAEADANQLGGTRPAKRYTIAAGRFTLTDFFDNNRYTHDPRTQFMGWAVMFNGAWDYPADVRGYTWGWMHELHMKNWSLRYASAAEPTVANGGRFDRRLLVDRGDVVEGELRWAPRQHPGALRVLHFENRTRSGKYSDDLNNRRPGTLKYGFGINTEQEITHDLGFFTRLGWADGKNEDFAFTAIDRLASGGVSLTGIRWRRREDTVGSAFTVAGISGAHAAFLARGGYDFLLGDGRLNYAPEYSWETYYSARIVKGFFATLAAQHIANPAYNHDRGPVWAYSLRLHLEGGLPK